MTTVTIVVAIVGSIGTIVSIVINIVLFRASRNQAEPVFQYASRPLISIDKENVPDDAGAFFGDEKTDSLTRTELIIWNRGLAVLDDSAIPKDHPITVSFSDRARIFRYRVLKIAREASGMSLSQVDECMLKLHFLFLDHDDGIAIELLHDSKVSYPTVGGTIIGLKQGIRYLGTIYRPRSRPDEVGYWSIVLVLIVSALLLFPVSTMAIVGFIQGRDLLGFDSSVLMIIGLFGMQGIVWSPRIIRDLRRRMTRCPRTLVNR